MELTKEQIEYIDNRLKNEGVKYWDIRIELLDHIVTEVEYRLDLGNDFKKAVQNAMVNSGWNGSFEKLTRKRLFGINRIVRKQFFDEFLNIFKSKEKFICAFLLTVLFFFAYQNLSFSMLKKLCFIILLIPVVFGMCVGIYNMIKYKKSGYIEYGSSYTLFPFLILSMVLQFISKGGFFETSEEIYSQIIFVATVLNSLFSYAGLIVYLRISKKMKELELKLIS